MNREKALELYNQNISDYDQIAHDFSVSREKDINFWPELAEVKKYLKPGQKVLDIGSGNGRFFEASKDQGISYYGVEPSDMLLHVARGKHGGHNRFAKGDFLNIPFGDGFFDVVIAIASFHRVPSADLRKEALKEVKRVLKKDGLFIITVWNLWQPKYERYIVRGEGQAQKMGLDVGDSLISWQNQLLRYYHAFTLKELDDLLSKKFEILALEATKFNIFAVGKK